MSLNCILVADAERPRRATMVQYLESRGDYGVVEVDSLIEARHLFAADDRRFAALVVGYDLLDGDGPTLCADLRSRRLQLPILLITEPGREADIVRGLDSGASDCVPATVRCDELLARLRAQLRAAATSVDLVLWIDRFQFRPAFKSLFNARNQRIWLTGRETELLRHLHGMAGKPMPRNALLHAVWGPQSDTTTHTLETHVYRLRRKMEVDPGHPSILVSSRGGYCLNNTRPSETTAAVVNLSELKPNRLQARATAA